MTEARARSGEAHPQREFHVRSAPPIQSGKTGIVLDFTGHSAAAVRPAGIALTYTGSVPPTAPRPDPKAEHRRTTDRDGISALEGYRFLGAVAAMHRLIEHRPDLSLHTAAITIDRNGRDKFRRKLGEVQREEGITPWWVTVRERGPGAKPNEHEHIIFVGNKRVVGRLTNMNAFKGDEGDGLHVQLLRDRRGITYCLKELSPSADRELRDAGELDEARPRRRNRTYPLPSGGDRVWLSEELKAVALEAGLIEPWKQSKRRDKQGNDYPAARRRPCLTTTAPVPAGQIPLFDDPRMRKPVNRLAAFAGGLIPPVVALDIEHHRRRRQMTQDELAESCGIRQPTLSNALAGRYRLSAWVTRRLRDILLAEAA